MRSKTDFDRDLDDYLSHRSRKQFFHNVVQTFRSKSPSIKLNPEIETYEEHLVTPGEKEHHKQGFFARLFGKDEASVEFQEMDNPTRDELKFVAQIALDKIKKLPSEELELFKVSAEFEKFKEILKRYDLIR